MWTRGKTYHISRFDLALNLTLWWRNVYLNSIEWKGLEFRSLNTDRFNDLGRILKYSPNSIYMLLISTDSKNLPSHALWPGRVFIISQQDALLDLTLQDNLDICDYEICVQTIWRIKLGKRSPGDQMNLRAHVTFALADVSCQASIQTDISPT